MRGASNEPQVCRVYASKSKSGLGLTNFGKTKLIMKITNIIMKLKKVIMKITKVITGSNFK